MRTHIEQANARITNFLETQPLVFKDAEMWRSEIEANSAVLDTLPPPRPVLGFDPDTYAKLMGVYRLNRP